MEPHSCHRLLQISLDAETWDELPPNVTCFVQCGTNFGMLSLDFECSCCNIVSHNYFFFTMAENDAERAALTPFLRNDGRLQLLLPDKTIGLFGSTAQNGDAFNDSYILWNVTCATEKHPENLRFLFERIQKRVAMRASLNRLRNHARRTWTASSRALTLRMLSQFGVNEVSLRIHITTLAELW